MRKGGNISEKLLSNAIGNGVQNTEALVAVSTLTSYAQQWKSGYEKNPLYRKS